MTVPNRQRLYVATHLSHEHGPFSPEIHPAAPAAGKRIASINVIEGLTIQSDDAGIFRALAAACELAARSIEGAQETAA